MSEGITSSIGQPSVFRGSRRELLLAGAFAAAATVAFVRKPRTHVKFLENSKLEALVPPKIGNWQMVGSSGLVLPPPDQLRDKIYSQLLTRTYSGPAGEQIMLLVAYSPDQDGVVQVHRPEICYPASGYKLTASDDHFTKLAEGVVIPSRHIVAEGPARREEIVYWTRFGDSFPRRWSEQRESIFVQNLRGLIPDGALVRISSIGADVQAEILDQFAADLYQAVGQQMRRVLAGSQG